VKTILRNTLISIALKNGTASLADDFGGINYVGHQGSDYDDKIPHYQSRFIGCVKVL
jgi:hypothetical protein